jgi:hypothetical protein
LRSREPFKAAALPSRLQAGLFDFFVQAAPRDLPTLAN